MVFAPLASVNALVKLPLTTDTAPWSTPFSFTVTVTDELVASLVEPCTVIAGVFVKKPLGGLVTLRMGGTVSTV